MILKYLFHRRKFILYHLLNDKQYRGRSITTLSKAIKSNNTDTSQLLIEMNARPNKDGLRWTLK
jgi:hypothetical protein